MELDALLNCCVQSGVILREKKDETEDRWGKGEKRVLVILIN